VSIFSTVPRRQPLLQRSVGLQVSHGTFHGGAHVSGRGAALGRTHREPGRAEGLLSSTADSVAALSDRVASGGAQRHERPALRTELLVLQAMRAAEFKAYNQTTTQSPCSCPATR